MNIPELPEQLITGIAITVILLSLFVMIRKQVWSFLRQWEEVISLPVAFVLFFFSSYIFWYFDKTAAVFDIGALQLFVFATVGVLWANGLAWVFIRRYFPTVYAWMQNVFDDKFDNQLSSWERIKFFLFYFFGLFFGFILLVRVL